MRSTAIYNPLQILLHNFKSSSWIVFKNAVTGKIITAEKQLKIRLFSGFLNH